MTESTETDQPSILRLLSEQGVDGQINPLKPERPGCVALFPAVNTDMRGAGTWYIVDKKIVEGIPFYILTTLSDATAEEAVEAYREYARRFVTGPTDLRMNITEVPVCAHN